MKKLIVIFCSLTIFIGCYSGNDIKEIKRIAKEEGDAEGYARGLKKGKSIAETSWIDKGKKIGYANGYAVGDSIGYDRGLKMGQEIGEKEGEKIGYRKGTVAFVKDSWMPTWGTVFVVIFSVLLLGLLTILLGEYHKKILAWYSLKVDSTLLINKIASRKESELTFDRSWRNYSLEMLKSERKRINNAKLNALEIRLEQAKKEGNILAVRKLVERRMDIDRADEILSRIESDIMQSDSIIKEKIRKEIRKAVSIDKSIDAEDKKYILENI